MFLNKTKQYPEEMCYFCIVFGCSENNVLDMVKRLPKQFTFTDYNCPTKDVSNVLS